MEKLVTSGLRLGIVAGGQLGKLLALAASNWDVKTIVMDRDPHCPASSCCTEFFRGDPMDFDDVVQFGRTVDVLTLEVEQVNTDALKALRKEGVIVLPDPASIEIIQDKGLQKQLYQDHGIPTSPFRLYGSAREIVRDVEEGRLALPFVQKLRRGGYDGRGVAVIRDRSGLEQLLDGPSVVEDLVNIRSEIAVIAARNGKGETACFPAVEMEFNPDANLVEALVCPASIGDDLKQQAESIACTILSALGFTGLLAIEFFVDASGHLLVNEAAPRPHNSGHHTIESAMTSQYEQLLRAIFNLPLGSTQLKMPAVMINLLGEPGAEGPVRYEGLTDALAVEGVAIHLYGKRQVRPFRKMGHATVLASTVAGAREKAALIRNIIKVTV